MLVIRLARTGRHKYPTYRLVAAESARAVTGKFVAILGHYNPHTKELVIKKAETLKYLGNGAQPSNTVIKLLQREKVELPEWAKLKTKTKPAKKAPEPKPEKAEVAPEKSAEALSDADVPAVESERVAVVAEEHAEEVNEKVPETPVETAEAEEKLVDAAVESEAKSADVALEAAEEEQNEKSGK